MALWGDIIVFFIYLLTVILHEFAHAIAAKNLGYKINRIWLLPFGAGLSLKQNFYDHNDEIIISLAGPLFNFFLSFVFIAVWWIYPETYTLTQTFVMANLVTGIINLLPCYPLDGGRVLVATLCKKFSRTRALRVCFIFNYILAGGFLVLFLINVRFGLNPTLLLFPIFIILGTFENKYSGSYNLLNYPFKTTYNKNGKIDLNLFAVDEEIYLYKLLPLLKKNKYNIIYIIFKTKNIKILRQEQIEKILIKYELNLKINEIL